MNTKPMNICMISDDNYAMYTGIALTSLKRNKDADSYYVVYILSDKITNNNKARLRQLDSVDFSIKIVEVSGFEDIKDEMNIATISATPTSLYKFRIPELLDTLDRVMYVDGDVLFIKDLKDLYFRDFCDKYAIVTPEITKSSGLSPSCKRLGINHSVYFCSGLMLLNIPLLKNEDIPKQLIEYRINGLNFLMDQDAFNVIFNDNILCYKPIDFVPWYDVEKRDGRLLYGYKTKRAVINHATVLHLCSKRKAWVTKMPIITKMYLKYHRLSPFYDIPISPISYSKQCFNILYENIQGTLFHKLYRKIKGKRT